MMEPIGLAARFMSTASRNASRTALLTSSGEVTYGELLADAQRLANALMATGTDSPVAITVSRTRASVTAILGAILANLPYAPVDAAYPNSRLRFMLDDLAAAVHIDGTGAEPVIRRNKPSDSTRRVHPDAIYILYTSGSTGTPKGCIITHRNVLSLFDSTAGLFLPSGSDVSAVLHSLGFDFSVWEIWSSWLYGGACWLADADALRDPARLSAGLENHQITRLSATPSLFGYLASAIARRNQVLPRLRSLVLGGEAVRLPDVGRFLTSGCAPNVKVVNMYGITETTVHVTFRELTGTETAGPSGSTPIGLPIPSLRMSLRDEFGKQVTPGAAGEIWISGEGVSAGYLNRPELTAEHFVKDDKGTTWYRSGDMARYNGAEYHYIGRRDRQVQLRGFRIELGEVEAVLESFDEVGKAITAIETRSATGLPSLVAYIKVNGDSDAMGVKEIKDKASHYLPPQAVPQTIHLVRRLPLSQNGKIDMAELRRMTAKRG
jgi:amino acid adenylation domain-containing protein